MNPIPEQIDHKLGQKKDFLIRALYYGLWAGLFFLVLYYGLGLITPFVFAFLFAYALRKLAERTSDKTHIPVKPLCVFYVLLFYSTIGVLIAFIGIGAVARLSDFVTSIPNIYEDQLQPLLNKIFQSIQHGFGVMDPALVDSLNGLYNQLLKSVGTMFANFSGWMVSWISGMVTSVPILAIKLVLMIIATFFAAVDMDRFTGFIKRQFSPEKRELLVHIKGYLTGTVAKVLRAYLIIMSITAIELSIGLTIIGVNNAILVGISIAIFDILPVFGTGGIMIPWTIITLIQGDFKMAIMIFAVYVIVTIVRNIIEPKLVGPRLGLHPLVTLMCIFVGAQLFGVIGLFGLPIGLSLVVHLNNKGAIHVFK